MVRVRVMVMVCCLVLLAGLLSPCVPSVWAADSKDTNYTNARFGFLLLLPPGHSKVLESDNGDGMRTTYAGGLNVVAWGSNTPGVLDQSLADVRADVEASLSEVFTGQVNNKAGSFTFKGIKGTDQEKSGYYTKQFVNNGVLMALEITWPLPEDPKVEALISALGKAFRLVNANPAP